jgi:hypothetical protein
MRDVSFILTGRDDGYTGDFITRFAVALKKNIEILYRHELDWEIIVVDYNPIDGKFLKDNEQLKDLLDDERVVNIIVDQSVLIDDGLPKNGFYEYFGKNCAALKASGEFLFMTNADIIISNETVLFLKDKLRKTDYKKAFYRWRFRQDILAGGSIVGDTLDLYNPRDQDGLICGGYSGDATLFHKDVFIDVATGYNETDEGHRTPSGQASMDGEILWNLRNKGIETSILDIVYYHVTHPRQPKDDSYSRDCYCNPEGWGYSKYPVRYVNENTIEVYA